MFACSWLLSLTVLGWGQDPQSGLQATAAPVATTADTITFRDGKVLLGQLVETTDRRGPLVVLVRRAWAEAHLPDRAAAWEAAEEKSTRSAEQLRHVRLVAWRGGRPAQVDRADALTSWLDAEIARLSPTPATGGAGKQEAPARSALMVVRLNRTTIKGLDHKPRATGRLLRLGWTLHLADPETMPLAELTQGLEDKGFLAASDTPVSVDALLPIPLESEEQWLIRRAATELTNLGGGRLLLVGGAVVPEPAAGEAPPIGSALGALTSTLQDLLGEEKKNPLPPKLRELANEGRVGAVVTGLEMAPDLSTTTVTTTLWVHPGGNRDWVAALQRFSTVRPADLPADAGANLAEDPQVKSALSIVSSLGLGEIPQEMKQRSLNMGFATQKALGDARAALNRELSGLAIPLETPRRSEPAPKP